MASEAHGDAIAAYDEALAGLYRRSVASIAVGTGNEREGPNPDASDDQLERVEQASAAAGEVVAALLQPNGSRVQEVAQAQLVALAARDFAVAHDLAGLDPAEGADLVATELEGGSALAAIEPQIAAVLNANPRDGLPIPPDAGPGISASANPGPCAHLGDGLSGAVDTIQAATAEIVEDALGRIADAGVGPVFGAAAGDLLQHLPADVRRWWRWAVAMFRRGVEKLRSLFGPLFDRALAKVHGWLVDRGIDALLETAYRSSELKAELVALVPDESHDQHCAAVATAVEQVVGKFETQKRVLLAVFKALGFCESWILRLIAEPYSRFAVAGAFALGAGYAVFSGGDYLDWHRTAHEGAFDFVKGVRRTAQDGLP
jgi:hypothetical protein